MKAVVHFIHSDENFNTFYNENRFNGNVKVISLIKSYIFLPLQLT